MSTPDEIRRKVKNMFYIAERDMVEIHCLKVGIEAFMIMATNGVLDPRIAADNKDRFRGVEVRPLRDIPPFEVVLKDAYDNTIDRTKL